MDKAYLLLWLEAPLQSWGHDSKFGRRDSLDFPTKSGVLGLICCARGAGGEEREWLRAWEGGNMQVSAYTRRDRKGEPTPRLPMLRDFHMVGSGYDGADMWETLHIPKTSDGKKAVGGGTKMTYRYYVQDMAYSVVLEGPRHLAEEAASALVSPVWDLYLGRKNCAPTEFVGQGLFDTAAEAYARGAMIAEEKQRALTFTVRDGEGEGETLILNDMPVQFGPRKQYRDRRVTIERLK